MDADRFPVQWQLLSSMVHGGGHLFHGNNLPDLQIQADESTASSGSFFAMPLGFWERRIMASAAGSRL